MFCALEDFHVSFVRDDQECPDFCAGGVFGDVFREGYMPTPFDDLGAGNI